MSDNDKRASLGRLQGAMWFAASERLLSEENGQGNWSDVPGYYCATLAFELLLKAAAEKIGIERRFLRTPQRRHSLLALLNILQQRGFSIAEHTDRVLTALNPGHENHQIRYEILSESQSFPAIPWQELRATYEDLVMLTHPSRLPSIIPTNFSNR